MSIIENKSTQTKPKNTISNIHFSLSSVGALKDSGQNNKNKKYRCNRLTLKRIKCKNKAIIFSHRGLKACKKHLEKCINGNTSCYYTYEGYNLCKMCLKECKHLQLRIK